MKSKISEALAPIFEIIVEYVILFSIPFGFQVGFCYMFGHSKVVEWAGIGIGLVLSVLAFCMICTQHHADADISKGEAENRELEKKLWRAEDRISRALDLMTTEQKLEYYKGERE